MHVCLLPTMGISLPEQLGTALPFGEKEAARLGAIKHPKRLRESYAALLALHMLVGDRRRPILRTGEGKPYFEKPEEPAFSLAHHGGLAPQSVPTPP